MDIWTQELAEINVWWLVLNCSLVCRIDLQDQPANQVSAQQADMP